MPTDTTHDDDNPINDPAVREAAADMAENALGNAQAELTLMRAAALLLAELSSVGQDPEEDLDRCLAEFGADARALLKAVLQAEDDDLIEDAHEGLVQ